MMTGISGISYHCLAITGSLVYAADTANERGIDMNERLEDYGYKYPDLVVDIVNFFSNQDLKNRLKADPTYLDWYKSFLDFSLYFKEYKNFKGDAPLQPLIFSKICSILCSHNILSSLHPYNYTLTSDDFHTLYYRYGSLIDDPYTISYLNNLVYGFKYIYKNNKPNVLPVFVINHEGKPGTGTCFRYESYLVTAKHCIDNKKIRKIQIGENGTLISADKLNDAYIYTDERYDIAIIDISLPEVSCTSFRPDYEPSVLDEIITMGFPQHRGFSNFITTTQGSIAAIEVSTVYHHEIMLLTTRLSGGNSGGPVVNAFGRVIGIATEVPFSEKTDQVEYNEFGYGLAVPIKYINQILERKDFCKKPQIFVDNINDI